MPTSPNPLDEPMTALATVVRQPDVQEARTYAAELATFHVVDVMTFQQADAILGVLKLRIDKLHEIFDPICQAADKAHKQAVATRKEQIDPLERLKDQIGRQASGWRAEQERLRLAEQQRLQEEARRQEDAQRLAAAAQAEQEGEHDLAAAILDEAVTAPTPTVILPRATPKLAHTSFTTRYKAKVINKLVLVKAVANGIVPLVAVDENMPYLNNRARHEEQALSIPGVVAVPEDGTRVR